MVVFLQLLGKDLWYLCRPWEKSLHSTTSECLSPYFHWYNLVFFALVHFQNKNTVSQSSSWAYLRDLDSFLEHFWWNWGTSTLAQWRNLCSVERLVGLVTAVGSNWHLMMLKWSHNQISCEWKKPKWNSPPTPPDCQSYKWLHFLNQHLG